MALSVEALTVALGGRAVLRDVSHDFAAGRVTALLGPNGAGKSTLLRAMAALVVPQAGGVLLDGQDVAGLDPAARARRIGYLPQGGEAAWNVPAGELVTLGRLPHRSPFGAPSATDQAAVAQALAAADVAHLAERRVHTLSGGEQARVLLARVLAGEPDWLLADEPLAALDPAHQLDMLERLRGVAQRGAGVVIVLHDLLHAGRIADDVMLLRDGAVLAAGPARDVLTPETLRAVFDIAVDVMPDRDGRPRCIVTGR